MLFENICKGEYLQERNIGKGKDLGILPLAKHLLPFINTRKKIE
jgi:hypothetical protein